VDFRVVSIVREHGRLRGAEPALTGDGRTVTFAELDERSSRVAQALLAEGVGPGSRVAYVGKNAPEYFDVLFGAAKIGAVVAPINWRLTPAEISAIAADAAGTGPLVVDAEFAGVVEFAGRTIVTGAGFESWLGAMPARDPGVVGEAGDTVVQLYTSGTTSLPKGVRLSNSNFSMGERLAPRWRLDASAVTMVPMPVFHIGGTGWALAALHAGSHCVLVRDIAPAALVEQIETMRVTNAFIVPAVLQLMCAVPGARDRDYSSLRAITYGASPITSDALRRALDTFGAPLFQLYGMTETTGAIVQLDPGDHHDHLIRSAGRPYEWVEIRIVDPVTGADQPAGQVGEVWTRSPQNTTGYWNRPEETAKLVADGGWLRTGDAGYTDEAGYLFLTDRIKDMIVTGAENVYPIEVEEVLADHPGIADVAVIGVPDERWGETVKAIVVRAPHTEPTGTEPTGTEATGTEATGAELTEAEVLDYARTRLAGFKRPRSVEFVEALPRNPSGKILKKELRKPYWDEKGRNIS
jgi:acyl-CoA synthetase (AMP-forming)/AMP-acid ligase II